jgi:hypothetical protein
MNMYSVRYLCLIEGGAWHTPSAGTALLAQGRVPDPPAVSWSLPQADGGRQTARQRCNAKAQQTMNGGRMMMRAEAQPARSTARNIFRPVVWAREQAPAKSQARLACDAPVVQTHHMMQSDMRSPRLTREHSCGQAMNHMSLHEYTLCHILVSDRRQRVAYSICGHSALGVGAGLRPVAVSQPSPWTDGDRH